MALSAYIFLVLFITGMVLTLRYPFLGIATYIFEWHNHPPYMWWGDPLPNIRWSLVIAIVTVVSVVMNYRRLVDLKNSTYSSIWWLIGLTIWAFFVSSSQAVLPDSSFDASVFFLKLSILTFLMMFLVRSVKQYKVIIWTFILSVINFGRMAFEGGTNRSLGIYAPNASEENAISIHVVSMVVFLGLYMLTGSNWEKIITAIGMPFVVNLIILANSRACFLAFVVVGVLTFVWARGALRWRVLLGLIGAAVLMSVLANTAFWERQKTFYDYVKEESAVSRTYLWKGALRMALDYPMGVGGGGFEALAPQYVPELAEKMAKTENKTVHNTFLLALAEWGFVGLGLFIGFLIHSFVIIHRIRRDAKDRSDHRYRVDSLAIQFGMIAILVGGLFHDRLYAESLYWFAGLGVALRNIQVNEMLKKVKEETAENRESVVCIQGIPQESTV